MLIAVPRATRQVKNGKSTAVRELPVLYALELDALYASGYDCDTNTRSYHADDRGGLQDFTYNPRPEACVGAQVRDLPIDSRARLTWIHDEGLPLQLTERQRGPAGEGMLLLYRYDQGRSMPFADVNAVRRLDVRFAQNAQVERSFHEPVELFE